MLRKAAITTSLLVAVGCTVAYVQAQDSVTGANSSIYGQPGMLPAHVSARRLPEAGSEPDNDSLSAALREATADVTAEYGSGEVAQVAGTIKPSQYKSARPKPTYSNRNQTQGRRQIQAPPQQFRPAPSSIYTPVPTAPPAVEPPPARVADRFGGRAGVQAQPELPSSQAMLGPPVETSDAGSAMVGSSGGTPDSEPVVVPTTAGMRSVLKRPGDASSSFVPPPAGQDVSGVSTTIEDAASPSDAGSAESEPTGISARRTPRGVVVPSTAISRDAGPSERRQLDEDEAYAPRSIQDLALTGISPSLRISVAGPQSITVGKAATYVVNLFNDGDVDASQVQVKASIPAWVSISSGEITDGDATVQSDGRGAAQLLWNVPQVPARAHQTLRLVLAASEGRPFDLGLEWSMQSTSATAKIVVQQPQLELSLAGPADMIFGQQKVFTLTVSNPGSGDADRVVVSIASGDNRPQQIDVGSIPAGMQKEIPVQVVANHAGEMSMKAVAGAEGGLRAEAVGKVTVRRAAVIAAVEGPQLHFAGTDATYAVLLRNTGDAPADDMTASIALPPGAKYLGGIDGASATSSAIKWNVPGLPAGSERTYQLKLHLNTMGLNRVVLQVQNESGVAISAMAETTVEAVSDLKLSVNDPAAPTAVGAEATYEVTLVNRGTKSAAGVRVLMQFGEGVEPTAVEGMQAKVVPGQVVCEPLPQLAAGETVTFQVKAAADRAGTHPFRVEVTSSDNETRLVTEGTSRFFAGSDRSGAAARTAREPSLLPEASVPDVLQR